MEASVIEDSYWTPQIEKWKTVKLECARCGLSFYEINNIGSLACWQHPYYPAPNVGELWPCCGMNAIAGKTGRRTGCVRADHTTLHVPFDETHNVPIPKVIADRVLKRRFDKRVIVRPDSLSNTEEYASADERIEADSYVTIRRYDLSSTKNI